MRPEFTPSLTREEWTRIEGDLELTSRELALAPAGIFRQPLHDRFLKAERRATDFVNAWLAAQFPLERVENPRIVFSLDVDDVLEDESLGFSATGVSGVAALKLLQLGGVAVLLNTARSLEEARTRCETFQLLGTVSAFGGSLWDGVFDREEILTSGAAQRQLTTLRASLRSDPDVVVDSAHHVSLRASRIIDGVPAPIVGQAALDLINRLELDELTFWVAPRHTDFIDRAVDKAIGIERLRALLGVRSLPLVAMGDAECDVSTLRLARYAFLPAATLPLYRALPGQRLIRAHDVGDAAVWEAACQLVADAGLQRQVISRAEAIKVPSWLPDALQHRARLRKLTS